MLYYKPTTAIRDVTETEGRQAVEVTELDIVDDVNLLLGPPLSVVTVRVTCTEFRDFCDMVSHFTLISFFRFLNTPRESLHIKA